jgi:hypothetical protein
MIAKPDDSTCHELAAARIVVGADRGAPLRRDGSHDGVCLPVRHRLDG